METGDERDVPLELGMVGPTPAGDDSGTDRPTPRWRMWAGLGAALTIGAVVGIVANNARNDAAEYATVDLVGGTVEAEFASSPLAAQRLNVNLINTGPRELEILSVGIDGFTAAADSDQSPVTAAPGEWVRVGVTVAADCDTRPPGTLQVRVRTASGEQSAVVAGQPGDDQLVWAWQSSCQQASGPGLYVGESRTVTADAGGARIVLPVSNHDTEAFTITAMESTTAGLTMTPAALPVEVETGATVQIETLWTVTDCAVVARFTDVGVAVNIRSETMDTRVSQSLDSSTLVELVRLAVRACET